PRCAELAGTLWVDENHHVELFGLGPERMKFGIRELLAVDAAADQRAAQSEPLDRMFKLLSCKIRVLQGNRRQTNEPVRLCRADVGELLVLQFDNLTGEVGLCLV